jgi:hypothetical protein
MCIYIYNHACIHIFAYIYMYLLPLVVWGTGLHKADRSTLTLPNKDPEMTIDICNVYINIHIYIHIYIFIHICFIVYTFQSIVELQPIYRCI